MMKQLSDYQVGESLTYGSLTLAKVSDAAPTGNDPAETTVELWNDQYGQQWTPTLAFQEGRVAQPEFIPVNG